MLVLTDKQREEIVSLCEVGWNKEDLYSVSMVLDWYATNVFPEIIKYKYYNRYKKHIPEESWASFLRFEDNFYYKHNSIGIVSNSHNCPRNGVTNWTRNPDKPSGYFGVSGFLFFNVDPEELDLCKSAAHDGFLSDHFEIGSLFFGTGGGSFSGGRYQFRLFLDDWVGLKLQRERINKAIQPKRVLAKLSGEGDVDIDYTFLIKGDKKINEEDHELV